MNKKTIPIYFAFLCMGFGDVVGPLTSQVQHEYELSNMAAGLVTFMGFIMFGLLSIPAGIYQDKKSKKRVLLLGLGAAFLGLVLPVIAQFSSFIMLLAALLLLGTGATLLQVAGNPIMRDVSKAGKYSRNLSFGQFIKAISGLFGALIPLVAAKYFGLDWKVLFPIYSSLVLITLVYVFFSPIKEKDNHNSDSASFSSCFKLLSNPVILRMVIAIFLYVGAEVCLSAKLPNYLSWKFDYDIKELGLWGTLFFFLSLMTGRLLGGIILNWIAPKRFLIISAIMGVSGILMLTLATGSLSAYVIIAFIGLGFSNVFPLVFSITIDAFPNRANEISGLMVTAIIGGAIMPLAFGIVADSINLMAGFIVPALSLLYIFIISILRTNPSKLKAYELSK